MKCCLVSISIFSCSVLNAQDYRPGYIIKINGDSLSGFVDNAPAKSAKICYFKATRDKKKEVFNPDQLKSFGINDYKHYESKIITTEVGQRQNAFVEVLVKGRASLFKCLDIFYVEKDSMFFLPPPKTKEVTKAGQSYLKVDNRYIGLLNVLLANCHLNANRTRYQEKSLSDLIQNYNRCLGIPGITYKTNKPWTKFNLRAFAGFDQTSESLSGFEKYAIKPSNSIPFGIGLDISLPRISDRFFFVVEAWLVNKTFQGYYEEALFWGPQRTDIFLHPAFLKAPIGFQLNLRRESNTPYIKFGFVDSFLTSLSASAITETQTVGTITTTRYSVAVDKRSQTGFWVGAGYTKQISIVGVFAEVRYEKNNGFANATGYSGSSGSCFNILLGLRY